MLDIKELIEGNAYIMSNDEIGECMDVLIKEYDRRGMSP